MSEHGAERVESFEPTEAEDTTGAAAEATPGRWSVAVSARSELLVVEDSVDDVGVVVFSNGSRQSPESIQAGLRDRLDDSLRASQDLAEYRQIPPLFQSVVKSVLEWGDELNSRAGGPVFASLVVLHSRTAPAIAHIGGGRPRLTTNGAVLAPPSFTLRGPLRGRARMLCPSPGRTRRIHLSWSTGELGPEAFEGVVQAEWDAGAVEKVRGESPRQFRLFDGARPRPVDVSLASDDGEEPESDAAPRRTLGWAPEASQTRPMLRKPAVAWIAAGLTVGLLLLGWTLGDPRQPGMPSASPLASVMARLGLSEPTFECLVHSHPAGAAITVDGKTTGRTTPATLTLASGEHTITVQAQKWGARTLAARGQRGDHVTLDASLWGSIDVQRPSNRAPVSVWVDDLPRGTVPVTIDSLAPGPHSVTFALPGVPPWGKSVEVRVNQMSEVVAQPVASVPSTGDVEITATMQDDTEGKPMSGASVWVDGKLRGNTPLSLNLTSGPHSFRASYHGEESAVTLLNLPGGNKRFVQFKIGSEVDQPHLELLPRQAPAPRARVATVSAQLEGIEPRALSEMWLYACAQDKLWRRFPMSPLQAPGGVVGVALLPVDLLAAHTPFYVSASATTGDEYFTEIQDTQALRAAPRSGNTP